MHQRLRTILPVLLLCVGAVGQTGAQQPREDKAIRISTELVQLDAVVTDKNGKVVSGLSKDDFELYEGGKKQLITFFEFVPAGRSVRPTADGKPAVRPSPQTPAAEDIRRIFGFVVDDLTIRFEDLAYTREMLTNFVNNQMQPGDLVAIVRTVGGKGLLQQFTTDKQILLRAIASLNLATHPLAAIGGVGPAQPLDTSAVGGAATTSISGAIGAGASADAALLTDDTNQNLRSYMSLGTTSFLIESMRQLPGRKSLVLVSGGLPILSEQSGAASGNNVSYFLTRLADQATRAGVAIHTIDIRGLSAQVPVARFTDTPTRSAMSNQSGTFGRTPDETLLGRPNVMDEQLGLRALANDTGGIAIINKNNFSEGLNRIVEANDGYYLLAYSPSDTNFKGDFRKVEVKLKHAESGWKVYSRRGYLAREDKAPAAPVSRQDRLLAAIRSPLARREIDLDAMILYKSQEPTKAAIDINLSIDPAKLQLDEVNGKQEANVDVAGFVFDEFGKMRGGFSETISASLTPEEIAKIKSGGLAYSANTTLPPGAYQVRLAVRDNKSGKIGTTQRYLEVPDLTKGRLSASSLLLGIAAPGAASTTAPVSLAASAQVSRKQDLRYAVFVYNAKLKDGKPQVRSQLTISQNGRVVFKEPEEVLPVPDRNPSQVVKVGQLGTSHVPRGRYTMTLVITDAFADKKANTVSRSMDFEVID
jgi:VWFA-related protein